VPVTKRLILTRALLTSSLLVVLAGVVPAQTTPHLDGVDNFRDIGGYKTADGHTIRHKLLYRSGELSRTTPEDRKKLARLGIHYEIDLRMERERAASPTHWGPNPPTVVIGFHYPGDGKPPRPALAPPASVTEVNGRNESSYASMSLGRAEDIGSIIRTLARADGPALIHCTAGKDRTGVTVAVLMTLLGASKPDVYRDYLRSNEGLDERVDREIAFLKTHNQPLPGPREVMKANFGVESAWLDDAFHAIDAKYHSFDAYTRDGLKLTSVDLDHLRARLLEK
jgi:protein-tyrosine phosphatase